MRFSILDSRKALKSEYQQVILDGTKFTIGVSVSIMKEALCFEGFFVEPSLIWVDFWPGVVMVSASKFSIPLFPIEKDPEGHFLLILSSYRRSCGACNCID